MKISETTKANEIIKAYPWLIDEAIKYDNKFQILRTPLGKMFLKNATIHSLSERAGVSSEEIIQKVMEMIKSRES